MLLAVDIGNSNVVFGLNSGTWEKVWRLETKDDTQQILYKSLDEHLEGRLVTDVVISSVVPMFTEMIQTQLKTILKVEPYLITPASFDKLPIKVLRPDQIGSDLVCDALAAHSLFNGDSMVVDFGTALTFTIIDDNKILGVNILPGLKTAMHALAIDTAKLHQIKLELPDSVIGKDTTTAIQSGILWGYVGLVERMIERIEAELGKDLKVVATGGLSKVLAPLHDRFDAVDHNLTLEGMKLLYEANVKPN